MKSRQKAATNANWTMVRVTGYLNCVRMVLPVLEESADVVYQKQHRKMNRVVDTAEDAEDAVRGPRDRDVDMELELRENGFLNLARNARREGDSLG